MHSRSVLCMTGHYNFYHVCMYVCMYMRVICYPGTQSVSLSGTRYQVPGDKYFMEIVP